MEVRLLGALEAEDDDGRPIRLTGAKVRALLTMLAMTPGEVVPVDVLADRLWGDAPPADVANALQALVSKLRRALGGPERIVMRGPGYALAVDKEGVDLHRFEDLVRRGRAAIEGGDPGEGLAALEDAEALWRGTPLADVAYEEFGRLEATRLEELRLAAAEDRAGAQLALGLHGAAVGELEALVAANPLREQVRGLLMLALYRAGRQSDALRVFQEGRTLLADELGLDPGPELRRLEAAILDHDPILDLEDRPERGGRRPPRRELATTNVRAPLTGLLGRAAAVDHLTDALAAHRLVTVVGPGGAGKTRLAVEVALAAQDQRADGSWFVDLTPAVDGDGVVTALVGALGLAEGGGRPSVDLVVGFTADRDVLLVLDNAEQVVDAVADVAAQILARSPALRLLVTSREALRVPGEVVWALPPLDPAAAEALFVERARAVDSTFEIGDGDAALITEICTRLDHLPLAIELAAARARAFTLAEIAARLDDRFTLLTGGARTARPHQQTLRAVIDWSYDLLDDQERRVLRRLSVFAVGCTLESAEAVCADEDLAPDDVADLIARLVDRSLVQVDRTGGERRYRLLQTLAEYGRERLVEAGDHDATRNRLAGYVADRCARSRAAVLGDHQREWLVSTRAEVENLRAGFEWLMRSGDRARAIEMAGALGWFWWSSGRAAEGTAWIDEALAVVPAEGRDASDIARAVALTWRFYLAFHAGLDVLDLDALADEAADLARQADDDHVLGMCLLFHGQVTLMRGEVAGARRLFAEGRAAYRRLPDNPWVQGASAFIDVQGAVLDGALSRCATLLLTAAERFEQAGDHWSRALAEYSLADVCEQLGDLEQARASLESALDVSRTLALPGLEATLLARLGSIAFLSGDVDAARAYLDDALALSRRLAYPPSLAVSLLGSAAVARADGRLADAADAATEALHLYSPSAPGSSSELPAGMAGSLTVLGWVALDRGDAAGALDRQRRAVEEAARARHDGLVAAAAEGVAAALAAGGDAEAAAVLLGAVGAWRDQRRVGRTSTEQADVDRVEDGLRSVLGGAGFDRALARGAPADPVDLVRDRSD